jgi:hypothetical protein
MKNKPKVCKFLYWTPRILSILLLLFLAMFSLDIFDNCNNFLNCLLGLFMHNLPVIILAIFLWFAWKRELIGAITFGIGGLIYIGFMVRNALLNTIEFYMISYSLIIAGPAFLIAFLWYLNYKKK